MKKMLCLLMLACTVVVLHAQEFSSKSPFMTKSFSGQTFQTVKVETSGGNISITGTDGESRVDMYVQPSNSRDRNWSKDDIQKKLDQDYELDISVSASKLNAIAKPKNKNMNWEHGLSISFRIVVPHVVSSDLKTSGGNIVLSGLTGATHDFTTSGGNMNIEKISGDIHGRTSGGNIDLSDLKDKIDLRTSGGNIHAERCTGDMKLTTSGGDLRLSGLQGTVKASTSGGTVHGDDISGELSAHTSGGDVRMKNLSCSLDASTSGGNIDVSITTLGKYVTLTNSGGNVDLSIPGNKGIDLKLYADRIKTSGVTNFSGYKDEKHMRGTLNGGGIPVTVDGGGGGNIQLTLR